MFSATSMEVPRGKSKVYYVYRMLFKYIIISRHQIFLINSDIKQQIVQLKIIKNIAGCVDLLKDVQNLKT